MCRTARIAAMVAFVAGLVACQKPATPPAAKADPTTTSTIDEIGAFTGDWSGHGGEVVIDGSGHGVQTVHNGADDPGTKTQFAITSVKRTGDGLVADYSAEGKTGTLTFYCTSDGGELSRGDLVMDSWPLLYAETDDPNWVKHDAAIRSKRDEYCLNQKS